MKKALLIGLLAMLSTMVWAQNNVITYTANRKLEETNDKYKSGLHSNAFEEAIISHTFNNGVGTITFSADVKSIGYHAFYMCRRLTSVTFPNSVTSIGKGAFSECTNLTSITNLNSVTSIGEYAFSSCRGLTSVIIPNSVTSIGERAFGNVNNIVYNGTATGSPWGALSRNGYVDGDLVYRDATKKELLGCSSAAKGELIIPNSVTSIGKWAFCKCNSLTYVTIPNSVTSIGDYAFYECTGLTSVIIPNSVTSIGNWTFSWCLSLTSVTIPNSVTNIGEYAFQVCSSLTSVIIPNSVTNIEKLAFSSCSSLTSVIIPNSVTSIGENAFNFVKNIVYNGTATGSPWGALSRNGYVDGYLVYRDATKKELLGCSSAAKGELIIPNSVTSIGNSAFYECKGLTSVIIPNSVTSIGNSAFYECKGLTSVTIPNSVTSIGNSAFYECKGLTSVTIPNSVTSIGNSAFYECKGLTSVIIPNSVTSIGEWAFYNCDKLTTIRVPSQSIERFKSMEGLKDKGSKIVGYDELQFYASEATSHSSTSTSPQSKSSSTPQSAPAASPAFINYLENSLQFVEENANNTIEANEKCSLRLQVKNSGKGAGNGCVAKISASGNTQGLTFQSINLPSIPVGTTQTIEIPISANMQTADGSVTFTIEITEPHGFGTDPIMLTVPTQAFDAPLLKIVDYIIDGGNATTIKKKTQFELRILLQNVKNGTADNVTMQVSVPDEVIILDGEKELSFASIMGSEQKKADYQFVVSSHYTKPTLPISITLREKYGKYAESKTISIPIENTNNVVKDTLSGTSSKKGESAISIGTLDRDGSSAYGTTATSNNNHIESVSIVESFAPVSFATALSIYNNEFASFVMDRDDSFPYAVIRLNIKGASNKVRLAKTVLLLYLGHMFQVEKIVTSYDNQILFLVPRSVRSIFLTCGDGCERILLFSGQLEGNKIYDGTVEVK